ncbi:transcriptional repressor LexA [Rhodospirillaceae bacterium AH-315-P19]|nr:transcriptional repressor LexA [Rhodospirillaceae bacterium AH-315-P19]
MLTKKQHELLTFIHQRLNETGVAPSFDEMKVALNLKSKSGIHRLITALEERGFIRRLPHRARALEVLKLPEAAAGPHASDTSGTPGEVIRGNFRHLQAIDNNTTPEDPPVVELPLFGRIAAGTPIEALRDPTATIDIPGNLIGNGNHYALEVAGDSMIDAGIHDGDTAIIQECETAENGAIIVAFIDNEEVTLKRLRRKGPSIALEPANKDYETRIFGKDRVRIQGKLVALYRQY